MRRLTYQVRWRKTGWACKLSGKWIIVSNVARLLDKETYVAAVKALARDRWEHGGKRSEVVVYTKTNKIGKGKGSRTTYGADPVRHKG